MGHRELAVESASMVDLPEDSSSDARGEEESMFDDHKVELPLEVHGEDRCFVEALVKEALDDAFDDDDDDAGGVAVQDEWQPGHNCCDYAIWCCDRRRSCVNADDFDVWSIAVSIVGVDCDFAVFESTMRMTKMMRRRRKRMLILNVTDFVTEMKND
jgi:hypothetical protein